MSMVYFVQNPGNREVSVRLAWGEPLVTIDFVWAKHQGMGYRGVIIIIIIIMFFNCIKDTSDGFSKHRQSGFRSGMVQNTDA